MLKLILITKEPNLVYLASHLFCHQLIITLNKIIALKLRVILYFYKKIILILIKY